MLYLPNRAREGLSRWHLRYSTRCVIIDPSRLCDLPLRCQPEMHPKRHIYQDDVGRSGNAVRNGRALAQARR
jgi:hypothetical protein